MNIIVTGAAGFIASHLSEKLIALGHRVIGIDNFDSFYKRDLKEKNIEKLRLSDHFLLIEDDIQNIENHASRLEHIDIVIHLAAKAGVRPSIDNPQAYIETNILGTQAVLNFCKNHQIQKFIFASSSSVYGNNKTPFSESDNVDHPISPYAFTKKCGELMLSTFAHLYEIDYIALRFFTVYGPRQRPDLAINKFVQLIQNNQPITVYGDGTTGRDYTYVDDIVLGILSAIDYLHSNSPVSEIINLGNHSPILLKDMVDIIYQVMKKEPQIEYQNMQAGDVDFTYAQIDKAGKLLNYRPQTSFPDGIAKFVEWKKKN